MGKNEYKIDRKHIEEVKAYLNQARDINHLINSKLAQLSSLRELTQNVTARVSVVPPSGTPDPHSLENTLVKIADLDNSINKTVDCLVDLKTEIMQVINQVPDARAQEILSLRYLLFKDWRDIGVSLKMQRRNLFRVHNEALMQIQLPENWHRMALDEHLNSRPSA